MAVTMQSIVDLARLDLDDASKVRNADDDMLKYANDAISRAYAIRPDMRFGNYTTTYSDLALTDNFPLELQYRKAVADFIVACCETHDDPFAVEQRALQAMKIYMIDLGFPG